MSVVWWLILVAVVIVIVAVALYFVLKSRRAGSVLAAPASDRLMGFTLNKRGRFAGRLKSVLSTASVAAIGPDAVMVDSESSIEDEAPDDADLRDLVSARPVLGNRVLSADGTDLGEVGAVILSTGDEPCAVGYELRTEGRSDTTFVPISAQMSLSGDNLVLPVEATDFVRNDLAGFGAAIASYRSSALEAGQ